MVKAIVLGLGLLLAACDQGGPCIACPSGNCPPCKTASDCAAGQVCCLAFGTSNDCGAVQCLVPQSDWIVASDAGCPVLN